MILDLSKPDTWQVVADSIGDHPYTYDLSDESHRLDVVQIVCEHIVKVTRGEAVRWPAVGERGGA